MIIKCKVFVLLGQISNAVILEYLFEHFLQISNDKFLKIQIERLLAVRKQRFPLGFLQQTLSKSSF